MNAALRGPSERRDSENLTRTGGRRGEGEAGVGRAALLLLLDGGKPFPKQSRQRGNKEGGEDGEGAKRIWERPSALPREGTL